MTTTRQQTRREREAAEAAALEQKRRQERDATDRRRASVQAKIDALTEERTRLEQERREAFASDRSDDAARATDWLEEIERELPRLVAELEGIGDALAIHARAHDEAHRLHSVAQQRVQHEPCELALIALDDSLREVERRWIVAAEEARALSAAQDDWGTGWLRRLQNAIGNIHAVGQGGPHEIHLPHFDADE